jgi:hypothetical protein
MSRKPIAPQSNASFRHEYNLRYYREGGFKYDDLMGFIGKGVSKPATAKEVQQEFDFFNQNNKVGIQLNKMQPYNILSEGVSNNTYEATVIPTRILHVPNNDTYLISVDIIKGGKIRSPFSIFIELHQEKMTLNIHDDMEDFDEDPSYRISDIYRIYNNTMNWTGPEYEYMTNHHGETRQLFGGKKRRNKKRKGKTTKRRKRTMKRRTKHRKRKTTRRKQN